MRFLDGPIDNDWYAGLFDGVSADDYACDFSTSTARISDAGWRHLAQLADDIRIIYIIRNPVERFWSHIKFHHQILGRFDELHDYSRRDYVEAIRKYRLVADGFYGTHYRRMLDVFPQDRIRIVLFDDIKSDPSKVLSDVEGFLDIPSRKRDPETTRQPANSTKNLPMPDFIRAMYADKFRQEIAILKGLGIDVPDDWPTSTGTS